jgi:hypothetical protein
MQVKWKSLIAKAVVWMFLELILNLLGLDQLAAYSEFLSRSYSACSTAFVSS